MSQYLSYSKFKRLNHKEIDKFDVNEINENNSHLYILEVDLQYLDELHELHNDYLIAPEKLEISNHLLSKYCNSIVNKDGMKIGCVKKLVPSLGNKSKYVHRILKFK